MVKIFLLTDYQSCFGSKHNSVIYKNGMDLNELSQLFLAKGFDTEILPINQIDFRTKKWRGQIVLYTSQEDIGYYYKSFIEDIVLGLEIAGANVIPSYKYLRAHSNKVFMEILRDLSEFPNVETLESWKYGALEEVMNDEPKFRYPIVVKSAEGAMSKNVKLAHNKNELIRVIKSLASTRNLKEETRELIRSKKYLGYQKQSKYRKKIIIQNFIPGLSNDWKVLAFGDKFYIFERQVRKNDFRASGSGQLDYLYGSKSSIPNNIFQIADNIRSQLNVPTLSLDFALKDDKLYLLEFQALYFGTVGQWRSDCYFELVDGVVEKKENKFTLEDVYVDSVLNFLKNTIK
jgi:glutathione synthase/RimK-type ligase-like ATP-grasp enzyme